MVKHACLTACVLLLGVLAVAQAFTQPEMKSINDEAFQDKQRPPVQFEHDMHNAKAELYDCSQCHHLYENGRLIEDAMSVDRECSDCHSPSRGSSSDVELMDAYHRQCIGCHSKQKKGPLACGECHVKE